MIRSMARRRDTIPPFEIMRKQPPTKRRGDVDAQADAAREATAAATPQPAVESGEIETRGVDEASSPVSSASPGWKESLVENWKHWWSGGAPIVIRLPRGMALVLVLAMLGLLVLAYLTGHSQGVSSGEATAQARFDALERSSMRGGTMVGGHGGIVMPNGERVTPGRGRIFLPGDADPRRRGLNYPILARYNLDEAKRLANFIADKGVDTLVVSADNAGLFHVIPLTGFTSGEFGNKKYLAADKQFRDLGRQWKIHNNNRGDDLSSLYWDKHDP